MSFCTQCGHQNLDNAKFCSECGTVVTTSTPPISSSAAVTRTSTSVSSDFETPAENDFRSPLAISNTYAWTLAILPLAYAGLDVAFSQTIEQTQALLISSAIAFILNTFMVVRDQKILDEHNIKVSFWAGILFVPAYLFIRASRTKSGPAIPITWILSTFCYVGISYFAAATIGVTISTATVESQIQSWAVEQIGGGTVSIDCPDTIQNAPGTQFTCLGTANGDSFSLTVTIQNAAGDIAWVVD